MIWSSIMVLMTGTECLPSQVIYGVFCEDILEERPRYNGTTQFQPPARIFFINVSSGFFFFFFLNQNAFTIQDFSTKTKTQFPQSLFKKKKKTGHPVASDEQKLGRASKICHWGSKFIAGQIKRKTVGVFRAT